MKYYRQKKLSSIEKSEGLELEKNLIESVRVQGAHPVLTSSENLATGASYVRHKRAGNEKGLKEHKKRYALWTFFFLAPALSVLIVFRLLPSLLNLILSFFQGGIIGRFEFVGLNNFILLFRDGIFRASLINIGYYTLINLGVSLVLGFLLALLLQGLKATSSFRTLLFAPLTLSLAATTWLFWMMLNNNSGVVLSFLNETFGLPKGDLIYRHPWNTVGIALITIWHNLGLFVLIYLAKMKAIDRILYEAASIDGASFWRIIYHITFPLLKPTILFLVIGGLALSLQLFDPVYILRGRGGGFNSFLNIHPEHVTPAMYIYSNIFRPFQLGFSSGLSTVILIILLVIGLTPSILKGRKEL